MMGANHAVSVQSVDRALHILDLLQQEPKGIGITELSNKLDVSKSTVHRLLMSLWKKGYVQQNKETERYWLGLKCLQLGESVSENLDVRQKAKPYLEQLAKKTSETVHLVTLENNEIVYIDKIETHATIRMFSRVGKRAPLYCTGAGKAMLAFLSENERQNVYAATSFHAFTNTTITTVDGLEKHLEGIRENGFALDEEEHEEGIQCAASPIFDYAGKVVASVSVAGPVIRVKDEKLALIAEDVKQTAAAVSQEMGGF
ncbi:IclR family transcriptional regulator [Salibacterium salarium]|uniref:Glycerol operon regulatory protein n=1 Tax=Salibacterium salarium TaxID=284579 RepID=A0A3R9QLK5_9BACI|nr:IclR family transcriptional regulator [Salibacterium salarium]RSL33057.1 IclR family transcriptional regulator [Salibacterium salarium]